MCLYEHSYSVQCQDTKYQSVWSICVNWIERHIQLLLKVLGWHGHVLCFCCTPRIFGFDQIRIAAHFNSNNINDDNSSMTLLGSRPANFPVSKSIGTGSRNTRLVVWPRYFFRAIECFNNQLITCAQENPSGCSVLVNAWISGGFKPQGPFPTL